MYDSAPTFEKQFIPKREKQNLMIVGKIGVRVYAARLCSRQLCGRGRFLFACFLIHAHLTI